MKILRHPILLGLGFEAALIGTFMLFPVGPCASSAAGIIVLYLHYPGFLFSEHILRFTSDTQHMLVAPLVMAAIWISLLYFLRYLLTQRHAKSHSHDHLAEPSAPANGASPRR